MRVLLNGYTIGFLLILIILGIVMVKQIKNIKRELALQKQLKTDEVKAQLIKEMNLNQNQSSDLSDNSQKTDKKL